MSDAPINRVNPTRLQRFYRCEYDWYAYAHLGVTPLRPPPSPHRDRGAAFHALLEYAFLQFAETGQPYTYDGDTGKLVARSVLYERYRSDGTSVDEDAAHELLDAVRYQLQRFGMSQWEVVRLADGTPLVEADLRSQLGRTELQAKVDLVLRHRATGLVWLIDFKTSAKPLSVFDIPPFVEHHPQLALGREVLKLNGVNVDRSALLHLRSRAPEAPPLAYRGTARERTTRDVTKLACDWATYKWTLITRGEDPGSPEALKVRDGLQAQTFARWQVDITSEAGHAATMLNVGRASHRMLTISMDGVQPVRRMAPGHHRNACASCDYGAWCTAALRNGGKEDLTLLGSDYEAREESPLAGRESFDTPPFDPNKAYVQWADAHGRTVSPHEEFAP